MHLKKFESNGFCTRIGQNYANVLVWADLIFEHFPQELQEQEMTLAGFEKWVDETWIPKLSELHRGKIELKDQLNKAIQQFATIMETRNLTSRLKVARIADTTKFNSDTPNANTKRQHSRPAPISRT